MATAMTEKNQKPSIYEYDAYRVYLRDLYAYLKQTRPQFSYRFFSRLAGFRSPNFLKLVIEGTRNISPESIDKFSTALKLSREQSQFFRNLVLLNQATTVEEKKFYAEQLMRSHFYRKVNPLKKAQYAYYANWYFIPIRELVGVKDFREDPEWIAHQLNPPITAAEAKHALDELQQLGLLKKNTEGKLVQTNEFVSTGDEVASTSVRSFHAEMIKKGAESMDRYPASEREISSLTLSLSNKTAGQVKELIQRFRREILAIANQDEEAEGVHQINFQFFPLSKIAKGDPHD